jgi:hypothetical protein
MPTRSNVCSPSVGEKGQGRSARRLCWAPRVVKREFKPVSVLDATALRLEPRQPFALVEIEEHELDRQRDLLFRRGNLVKDGWQMNANSAWNLRRPEDPSA